MQKIEKSKIEAIWDLINRSQNILLVSHKNPDWDTLWSITAWYETLKNRGGRLTLACESVIPDALKFVPNTEFYVNDFRLADYDLAIICDAWAKKVAWFLDTHPGLFNMEIPVINIDHHLKNDKYWTINIIEQCASTTCLVYEIFVELWYKITPSIATSLLTWIYTDTWAFMHPNTDTLALRVGAELLRKWWNLRLINKYVFKTTKVSTLRLWGRVLESVYISDDNTTIAVVKEEDFSQTWATYEDLTWVADYINSIPGSDYTALLTERGWKIKWSLRTLNDDIDLTEIAWRFGWGGHKKASWFTIDWNLKKEVVWKVVNYE